MMKQKVFLYIAWSLTAAFMGGSLVAVPYVFTGALLTLPETQILSDMSKSRPFPTGTVGQADFPNPTSEVERSEYSPTPPSQIAYATRTLAAMSFAIPEKGKAILADLGEMTLKLFENGEVLAEYPILSKGAPGSFWETPTGSYAVKTKEEHHYSTIGNVWMPWSIQFFGNFFIHGWPSYSTGAPVPPGFSGGCIRLSEEDAHELFDRIALGAPIFVTNGSGYLADASHDVFTYISAPIAIGVENAIPSLSAEGIFAADLENNFVFFEKESDIARPIASLSKLMTALVSLEAVNQYQDVVIIPEDVEVEGAAGGLKAGQRIRTSDLLWPLLLSSSNDAAHALARSIGIDRFVSLMNEKAQSLGLASTTFAEPSGLSARNQSTPEDLFRLVQYLWTNRSSLLKKTMERGHAQWRNIHPFVTNELFRGGKTGFIPEAKRTMVAIFDMPVGEFVSRPIAIVALGSDHIQRDVERLRLWVKHNFEFGIPISPEQQFTKRQNQNSGTGIPHAPLSLLFAGDVMLDRGVKEKIISAGNGNFSFPFAFVRDVIEKADIAFANLEGPISDKGDRKGSIYSFRMDPSAVAGLKDTGFDIVSLANNHMGDYGREAFEDTIRRLRKANMAYTGAGWNAKEASQATTIEKNGISLGYLAFSDVGPEWMRAEEAYSGIALVPRSFSEVGIASVESVKKAVADAKKIHDIVVVSFHFGEEYQKEPGERQRSLAYAAIDAGAKIVIGHHPHVIQPIEEYHGGVIAYSLGNFIFDQYFSQDTMEGMMLEIELAGTEIRAIIPHVVKLNDNYQPTIE
jgi:poly-gamma-glutamate synthesis protein (capsule biosynthesis protein)